MVSAIPCAARPLVAVQFVGCPADGQQGPQAKPKSGRTPNLPPAIAAQLAYYSAPELADRLGVLAPRGWHCIALYGSSGTELIVTPKRYRADRFMRVHPSPIRGSIVKSSLEYGGTSGRWGVAAAIARFFPRYRSSIFKQFEGLSIGQLPRDHNASDLVHGRSDRLVRFETLPERRGWGTRWLLTPNSRSVEGVVKLLPDDDWFDVLETDVRLPPNLAHLTSVILDEPQPVR
jgi:hypothetical protein